MRAGFVLVSLKAQKRIFRIDKRISGSGQRQRSRAVSAAVSDSRAAAKSITSDIGDAVRKNNAGKTAAACESFLSDSRDALGNLNAHRRGVAGRNRECALTVLIFICMKAQERIFRIDKVVADSGQRQRRCAAPAAVSDSRTIRKCMTIDECNALRKRNAGQTAAPGKRIILDGRNALRNFNANCGSITIRNDKRIRAGFVPIRLEAQKRILRIDERAVGRSQRQSCVTASAAVSDSRTAVKGRVANVGKTIRKGYAGETAAVPEGGISDIGKTIRNGDSGEIAA